MILHCLYALRTGERAGFPLGCWPSRGPLGEEARETTLQKIHFYLLMSHYRHGPIPLTYLVLGIFDYKNCLGKINLQIWWKGVSAGAER